MTENSYRIRTNVGEEPNVINVKLNQTFDTLEILSLKLSQEDTYKLYKSNYGVVVGRVLANGGVGIPNAKVSVFIESENTDNNIEKILYPFSSVASRNQKGVRYNLLPDSVDDACYQNVGTFPNKRLVLDNNDVLEVFDKYYKYTTCTNQSGDFMLCNIPVGSQQIHVDVDLSDIGFLSQRPRDMVFKGIPIEMFESPNKFKQDTNIDNLSQIRSQNIGVYVFPFWGDSSEDDNIAITRCDIQIDYKFEPTCVFMGATVADNEGYIGKNCGANALHGKMANLITSQGRIEMIRKTIDGHVEEYNVSGNRLIDENGVFCYQIPMNLDYVTTDEFGNLVPTDDPNKGIPTRTSVRFRVTLDDEIGNLSKIKRCSYLVPNNPRINDDYKDFSETRKVDYEFGSLTKDENYRDLFWNKVYTVKSFIPRLQKDDNHKSREFTGIKWINHGGDKNRFPYNGLTIKLSFQYVLLCFLTKFVIYLISFINNILSIIGALPCKLRDIFWSVKILKYRPFRKWSKAMEKYIPKCIKLGSEFCDDGQNKFVFFPGCKDCVWDFNQEEFKKEDDYLNGWVAMNKPGSILDMFDSKSLDGLTLMTCVENALIQENECTSYNFYNDWINGTLFFPKWHRYIRPKKSYFFGWFKKKAKDEWCSANKNSELFYIQHCAVSKNPLPKECGDNCESSVNNVDTKKGIVVTKETMPRPTRFYNQETGKTEESMSSQTVYYYKAAEYIDSLKDVMLFFATDIVLLGSLNNNDVDGTPQFFKNLPITTYQLPTDILNVDHHIVNTEIRPDNTVEITTASDVEGSGQDWGNKNSELCGNGKTGDSGLFYGVGCSHIDMKVKSCINLRRICELGVTLDETQDIPINAMGKEDEESDYRRLVSDGFVSWDEIYDNDSRAMFATMNHNSLKTEYDPQTGYKRYRYVYLYPINFDGALRPSMEERLKQCDKNKITYAENYKLEEESTDYTVFRMGENPYYYDGNKMPRYENSFYFYFGLTPGSTALEKFQHQYFSDCENTQPIPKTPIFSFIGNKWCYDRIDVDEDGQLVKDEMNRRDGYLKLDLSKLVAPFSIQFTNKDRIDLSDLILNNIEFDKIYIGNTSEYLMNQNIISVDEAKIRNTNLDGYKHLSFDKYDEIYYDSDDVEPNENPQHKNTYLYDNCTLCNGNWHLTITDGEDNVVEIDVPFYTEKLKCNVLVDSFRIASNNLYQDITNINNNNNNKPPFTPSEWWKLVSMDDLTYNENTNRKEREIGGLIIIKDIVQEQTRLTNKNVYITIESINNILNEGYILYDSDGDPEEPVIELDESGNVIQSYYLINDIKYLCDPDTYYVYKLDEKGYKCRPNKIYNNKNQEVKWEDINSTNISTVIEQKQGVYYYKFNNQMCDKDGYLYDTKIDTVNGNKKFVVDSELEYGEKYVNDDYGFIHYDTDDTDEDKEKDVFYFGVPIGGQQYKITVTYKCSTDYNGDGYDDITDNTFTKIVTVNEYTPTKFYINNIDYDVIKNFKSGWVISDTRDTTKELHSLARTNNIVGWNKISDIGVQSEFTKDNIPDWEKLDLFVTYLSSVREDLVSKNNGLCPYVWGDEYIYNRSEYDELRKLIDQYYISATPKEIFNYQIANSTNTQKLVTSNKGFVYQTGKGDIYTLNVDEGDALAFVSTGGYGNFSFYKKVDGDYNDLTSFNDNKYYLINSEFDDYDKKEYPLYTKLNIAQGNTSATTTLKVYSSLSDYNGWTQPDINIPYENEENKNGEIEYFYYLKDVYLYDEDDNLFNICKNGEDKITVTIKILCNEKGNILQGQPLSYLVNNEFDVIDFGEKNSGEIKITNVKIFFEKETNYVYATQKGERYKLKSGLIFDSGSIYKGINIYYVYDKTLNNVKYFTEIPCDKQGYVYAVKYNGEITSPLQYEMYEIDDDYIYYNKDNHKTSSESFVIPNYVDVLCNKDGFVYAQDNLINFYYPDMYATMGGWWLGYKYYPNYPYRFYDMYNTTTKLNAKQLENVKYDTYGHYILDEKCGITFVETFNDYETTTNGTLRGFLYATENDGKTRFFKKAPRNNVFKQTNTQNNSTQALIYMYNPNIKNIHSNEPNKRGVSYLCNSEGYVYETTEDRKCIAEKFYKKILECYYMDGDTKILCDEEGYIYATTEGNRIQGKPVLKHYNSYGELDYYYFEDGNGINHKCDIDGYQYAIDDSTGKVKKTDEEITKVYDSIYTYDGESNKYYKFAKINKYYNIVKEDDEKYYKQYFSLTNVGTPYQDSNKVNNVYCDKYGYVYKHSQSDINNILTYGSYDGYSNELGYYKIGSKNEIIQLNKIDDETYYVYETLNGYKFKLSEEYKFVKNDTSGLYYYKDINKNGKYKLQISDSTYENGTIVKLNEKGLVKVYDENITKEDSILKCDQVNMPCDNNGYLYVVDEMGEKYYPLSDKKTDEEGHKYKVIDNKVVYCGGDTDRYVYDTYNGKKYKLEPTVVRGEEYTEEEWIVKEKDIIKEFLKKTNIKLDDKNYVYTTDLHRSEHRYLSIPLTRSNTIYNLQIPYNTENDFVYDTKNGTKYILPYEVLEEENNIHTCTYDGKNDVPCDKDGYVYETDENNNKIREELSTTGISDVQNIYYINDDDEIEGKYISLGGVEKLYFDVNDLCVSSKYLTSENKEEKYKINNLECKKYEENIEIDGETFRFTKLNECKIYELNDYIVYCDSNNTISEKYPFEIHRKSQSKWVEYDGKVYYKLYKINEGQIDYAEYGFDDNINDYCYNITNLTFGSDNNCTVRILCDEYGFVKSQVFKYENSNGNIITPNINYSTTIKNDNFIDIFYYHLEVKNYEYKDTDDKYDKYVIYGDNNNYVLDFSPIGNGYYANPGSENGSYDYYLKDENGNTFYDVNPNKVYVDDDLIIKRNNHHGAKYKLDISLKDEEHNYYSYNGIKINCGDDGYVTGEQKFQLDFVDIDTDYYYLIDNKKIKCDDEGNIEVTETDITYIINLSNENLTYYENLPSVKILGTTQYDVNGFKYLMIDGDRVQCNTVNHDKSNKYYYLDDKGVKIPCDINGFVYAVNGKDEPYTLNYEKTSNGFYKKTIHCDSNGYVYQTNVIGEKIKLFSETSTNTTLNNIDCGLTIMRHDFTEYDGDYKLNATSKYKYCDIDGNLLLQDEYGNFLFESLKLDKPYGVPYKLFELDSATIDINDKNKDYSNYIYFNYDIPNSNYVILKSNNGLNCTIYNDENGYYYKVTFKGEQEETRIDCDKDGRIYYFIDDKEYPDDIIPYKYITQVYCDRYGNIVNKFEEETYKFKQTFKWDNENKKWIEGNEIFEKLEYNVGDEKIIYAPLNEKFDKVYCSKGYVTDKDNEGNIYKLISLTSKIKYIEKNYTNTKTKMWCYVIEDVNKIKHMIFANDEKGDVKGETFKTIKGESYKHKYKLDLTINVEELNVDGTVVKQYYYIISTKNDDIKVLCDSDGCVIEQNPLTNGKTYLKIIYNYMEKYYYYDLGNDKVYCDAAGYVSKLDSNNKPYILENNILLYQTDSNTVEYITHTNAQEKESNLFYYISTNNIYLDYENDTYTVSDKQKTPIIINENEISIKENDYKLDDYVVKGNANYCKYTDATYCDKNGIIIENVKLKYDENTTKNINKDNILIYNSIFDCYELKNKYGFFIPCDKEGYLYDVNDNTGEINRTTNIVADRKYTIYYVDNTIQYDSFGNTFEIGIDGNKIVVDVTNGEVVDVNISSGSDKYVIYKHIQQVLCDNEGYLYDNYVKDGKEYYKQKYRYKIINKELTKITTEDLLDDELKNLISSNQIDGKNYYSYRLNNIPCDSEGYVYKTNIQGEKYKLENTVLYNNDDEYYYYNVETLCSKEGEETNPIYYKYDVDSKGNIIKAPKKGDGFSSIMHIPCDSQGYVYDTDEDTNLIRILSKKHFVVYNTNKQYYEYRYINNNKKNIVIPCDREGFIYKLKDNEPYVLNKEIVKSEYNVENLYKYKLSDGKKVRGFNELPSKNNLEHVHKYVIYNEDSEDEEYQLCNKDGFLIIEETKDSHIVIGNDIDGYEYSDSTKCDMEGYVYQSFGDNLATEEDLYSFYKSVSDKFVDLINNINIYAKRRIDFVKSMQESFWVADQTEPKLLQLASKTDFTPVEYKIGYIKEEFVTDEIDTDGDEITDLVNERYEIASSTYTFSNQNRLEVYIPTYTPERNLGDGNLFVGQNYNGKCNMYDDYRGINPSKYKAPYIVGMKNSINNTYPPIKAQYFKIENPLYIGRELFHLHFIDKPFKVEFECIAALVDYPVLPTSYALFEKSRGYINRDAILYNCKVHNGAIFYDDFDKNNFHFEKQMLSNTKLKMSYQGNRDEDGYIIRNVDCYENDWDCEGIMSRQSEEIKTETIAEFVCKPYIESGMKPCLLPPTRSQLVFKDNFKTLSEVVYSNMTITVLPHNLNESSVTELKYRINNGDGNEDVWLVPYDANTIGFGDNFGEMYDDKYHLVKYKSVIDFKNKVLEPKWQNSENNKYRYPKPDFDKSRTIKNCYYDNTIIDETKSLKEWIGTDRNIFILVAKTQNNCYAISKPFCFIEPAVYRLQLQLYIKKHGMFYKFASYHKSVDDGVDRWWSNDESMLLYYYVVTNMCSEYSFKKHTVHIKMPNGYSTNDRLKFANCSGKDKWGNYQIDGTNVTYVSYTELIEALNNYTYDWTQYEYDYVNCNINDYVISDDINKIKFDKYRIVDDPFWFSGETEKPINGSTTYDNLRLYIGINFDNQRIQINNDMVWR